MRRWILDRENPHLSRVMKACLDAIGSADVTKPMVVTLGDYSPSRSLAQNALYWATIVAPLADYFGYEKQEMHEVLLAEHFGVRTVGNLTLPLKRSSELTKKEMNEYLDWCPRFAAEQGVVLGV